MKTVYRKYQQSIEDLWPVVDDNGVIYNGKYYALGNTIVAKYNYITKAEDFFDIRGFNQSASDTEDGKVLATMPVQGTAIQAKPETVVEQEWNVSVEIGKTKPK